MPLLITGKTVQFIWFLLNIISILSGHSFIFMEASSHSSRFWRSRSTRAVTLGIGIYTGNQTSLVVSKMKWIVLRFLARLNLIRPCQNDLAMSADISRP